MIDKKYKSILSLVIGAMALVPVLLLFPITQPAGALILVMASWALVLAFAGAFD